MITHSRLCLGEVWFGAPECQFLQSSVLLFVDAGGVIPDVYGFDDLDASGVTVRVDDCCVFY